MLCSHALFEQNPPTCLALVIGCRKCKSCSVVALAQTNYNQHHHDDVVPVNDASIGPFADAALFEMCKDVTTDCSFSRCGRPRLPNEQKTV